MRRSLLAMLMACLAMPAALAADISTSTTPGATPTGIGSKEIGLNRADGLLFYRDASGTLASGALMPKATASEVLAGTLATRAVTPAALAGALARAASTPTVTAESGTITSLTASTSTVRLGKLALLSSKITVTDKGTASGATIITLPSGVVAAVDTYLPAFDQTTGAALFGFAPAGSTAMLLYAPGFSGTALANGRTILINGPMQIQ